jgi:hypothetical protein
MGEQRAEANRINAQRSSGPRTELGKSRSKMNALKHGLSAKKIVIGDEDPKEFEALRAALERDWQPETAFESELVDQLAGSLWRLRRVPAIEAAIVRAREEEAYSCLYSEIEDNTKKRIRDEITRRCSESFGNRSLEIGRALEDGTYDARLAQFRSQVFEEEDKKGDLDSSILKQAEAQYQESRESELLLLIRDDDGMIEKLSRYHSSLMNAANRVIQQLRLIKIMRSSRSLIAFE